MWLPIMTFFAHGYEHSIVNMYVIPEGMLLGAPVSVGRRWFWNKIPVTLGNILSGVVLTAWALHATYQAEPSAEREKLAVEATTASPAFATEATPLA